jgi:energy-coupling factor transporter transmembrane protein EcfT
MPFYAYGFEYGIVIGILLIVNFIFLKVNTKIPNRKIKAIFPFLVFLILCVIFIVGGLITLQNFDPGTCP